MRLINTTSFKLTEFFDKQIPDYAILSHVWAREEVSYEEYNAEVAKDAPLYPRKAGYRKIAHLCRLVRDGVLNHESGTTKYEWAWIDTVCIDKRSSAELSEAINSMYKWYKKAAVCLVFLPDVTAIATGTPRENDHGKFITVPDHSTFNGQHFRQSAWFTRGWTLQELMAPGFVLFFDTTFRTIGAIIKSSHKPHDYPDELELATAQAAHMDLNMLLSSMPTRRAGSVAVVMSWAAHRVTTREEDMSYCLLGLCGVNMPLLYGEGGDRALQRLQLEIISSSPDLSIYAFQQSNDATQGMLARHISQFAAVEGPPIQGWRSKVLRKTPRGLEFEVHIPQGLRRRYSEHFMVLLTSSDTRTDVGSVHVLFRMRIWSDISSFDDGYIEAQRIGCFSSSRESEASLWKQVLGWRVPEPLWMDALAKRDMAHYYLTRLSARDRARELMYKFYPAKTVKLWVPL